MLNTTNKTIKPSNINPKEHVYAIDSSTAIQITRSDFTIIIYGDEMYTNIGARQNTKDILTIYFFGGPPLVPMKTGLSKLDLEVKV